MCVTDYGTVPKIKVKIFKQKAFVDQLSFCFPKNTKSNNHLAISKCLENIPLKFKMFTFLGYGFILFYECHPNIISK